MEETQIKIENEIFEKTKDLVRDINSKEAWKIIETEIKNRNYLTEDWQTEYAVQRIIEKIEETRRQQREIRQRNVELEIKKSPKVKTDEEEFVEKVKGLVGPNEDWFQKSLHQEADLFKGIERHNYKSVWTFSAGVFTDLFLCTGTTIALFILITMVMTIIRDRDFSILLLSLFPAFFIFILGVVCVKLSKKLIKVFIEKSKQFKIKAILILIIPAIFFITILIGWIFMIVSSWR